MAQYALLLYIAVIGIVFSAISILIYKFTRNKLFPKYIPGIILLLSVVAFIIKARLYSNGMEGLGYIILAILAVGGSIISLTVPAAIDIYRKYSK
ncbi:MAG TPA: YesK family protein [Pseudobacteroides sp.]|jgi:hypothetical protein|nr:YesK family protein [Pseudobacteroides sp.]